HQTGKLARLFRVLGQVFEQLAVLLERRSAARRVGDDGVKAAAQNGVDVAAGELARLSSHPGMKLQRAATALALRHHHLAAVALQDPYRGLIQPRETHVGDAPGEERHALDPLAFRRKRAADLAEEERRLGRRRELLQIAQWAQQLQLSQAAHQRLEAADLEKVE